MRQLSRATGLSSPQLQKILGSVRVAVPGKT